MPTHNRTIAAIILVLALSLACVSPAWVVVPTDTPPVPTDLPTHLPTHTQAPKALPTVSKSANTATIRATVYVRKSASSYAEEAGSLETGDSIEIVNCSQYWCEIIKPVAGFVWRGCTSDNPEKLFCQARP